MKYCKINQNGVISAPQRDIPNISQNVINLQRLSASELINYNYYVYKEPIKFDPVLQKIIGYKIKDNKAVAIIEDRVFDIKVEKNKKIKQIQRYISNLLGSTDKYYIKKIERNIDIPEEILNERYFIHSECDRMKNDVQALTDVKSVLTYKYRLEKLQHHNITEV